MDFCLIFVPFGHYDEPEILSYAIPLICSIGADVRQVVMSVSFSVLLIGAMRVPSVRSVHPVAMVCPFGSM
jgi:hypothetical protein